MNIPSQGQCLELIEKMEMMSHIIDHSRMVQRVAITLGSLLKEDNPHLNLDLILAGAILHDITKTRSIKTGEKHAQTGGALLSRIGYPEVGEIVRQHVALDNPYRSNLEHDFDQDVHHDIITEAAIVNYADKRVLQDKVVPLEDRLSYIMERYGRSKGAVERIKLVWKDTIVMEQVLFRSLEITPYDLPNHIRDYQ